ncbi:tryptophan transporter [Clostridium paridis]|uniref:Tryptophan transporter n=1 Tax=Clostridium paridis TaxID=2803863 RepID=A0A937K5K6_9CLOT|nr:tryptophan transporter [Clostridium paridis]MBL4932460.1 tryptophan transporter [Clostridium paridis]
MNTKKLTLNAILLAIGLMLHQFTPALGFPMQPDFALATLFIIMMINKDFKTVLTAGIITGIFTALTTKFPGGQIPNIIDKVVTVTIVYGLLSLIRNRLNKNIVLALILPIGTLISGTIFLTAALYIVGLPAPFNALFITVVLPATVINLVAGLVLFKIFDASLRRSGAAKSFDL